VAAHEDDLRAEVAEMGERGEALVRAAGGVDEENGGDAPVSEADRAMLRFAVKLTRTPSAMVREDVEALRAVGFDDTAIHDIVQVTGFFNYYNRLADGLGIDPEPPAAL
jgi:uncharacterized peroxidase-related enzyme